MENFLTCRFQDLLFFSLFRFQDKTFISIRLNLIYFYFLKIFQKFLKVGIYMISLSIRIIIILAALILPKDIQGHQDTSKDTYLNNGYFNNLNISLKMHKFLIKLFMKSQLLEKILEILDNYLQKNS